MIENYNVLTTQFPWMVTFIGLSCLILAAWLITSIFKQLMLRGMKHAFSSTFSSYDEILKQHGIIQRLAHLIYVLVIMRGITLVPNLPEAAVIVTKHVGTAFIILTSALVFNAGLNIVNVLYSRKPYAHSRPIKSYLQLAKLVITILTIVLIIATLIDRSPLILLSGFGAMAAVLMLVFQDTILSLVASVQISSGDMVRVGDWIEMPGLNADGNVIDMALHTVKIQNWDKTITTLPTRRLITDPFKNWRGMEESGGRRIKRAIYLDQNSFTFLSKDKQKQLGETPLLAAYLRQENQKKGGLNTKRITNIGTFQAYIENYLRSHPEIHQDMTLIVRQLSPISGGLPLEIYCFTNITKWLEYERIQSDIFNHLITILPEFGLRICQNPNGTDVQALAGALMK